MMMRHRVQLAAVWLLCTSLGVIPATAQDLPLDRMISTASPGYGWLRQGPATDGAHGGS